jgi:hypothetical protein
MKCILYLSLLLVACTAKEQPVPKVYKETLILNRNDTLQIPTSLRQVLEDDYFILSPRPVERTETQKKVVLGNLTRDYLVFSAFLQDRQAVLKEDSYLFKMDGGGEIDLSQYLNGKRGEFSFGILLDEQFNDTNTKVYFLNNLKAQGCEEFREITKFFFSTISQKGVVTTTKDLVHLKLLVGAYVLIANIEDRYFVGQLHVTDSRVKTALCR